MLCKQVEQSSKYYEFHNNTRFVKPSILHFQLRNLLWATSKHDVYFMSNSTVGHWSSLSHNLSKVLDFSGHFAPAQGLADRDVKFCTKTNLSDNAITNAIDIHRSTSGGLRITVSNTDCGVREYDMEGFQLLNHFHYNWPVNHASVSPDRKLLAVVGDDRDALLVDSRSGMVTSILVGHLDYLFATAWHPDGRTFATGNQDKTCRVWDATPLTGASSSSQSPQTSFMCAAPQRATRSGRR